MLFRSFLHSTGQCYKGGPNSGVFLQITCDDAKDLAVPGQAYSFGVVKAAQARGDFEVLAERREPLVERWLATERTYREKNVRRACYLSMEFLIGRMLRNATHARPPVTSTRNSSSS